MTIWYSEYLKIPEQPEKGIVRLIGIYNQANDPSIPVITIRAEIQTEPNQTMLLLTLYTHNPSSLSYEEPSIDDINKKYLAKIRKARIKLLNTKFSELT